MINKIGSPLVVSDTKRRRFVHEYFRRLHLSTGWDLNKITVVSRVDEELSTEVCAAFKLNDQQGAYNKLKSVNHFCRVYCPAWWYDLYT